MTYRAKRVVSCAFVFSWLCACGGDRTGLSTQTTGTAGTGAHAGASANVTNGAGGTTTVAPGAGGHGGIAAAAGANGAAGAAAGAGGASAGSGGGTGDGAAGSFTFSAVESCSKDGWCWSTPLPQGDPLYSIWGSSASDVWAVGEDGVIIHFDGKTWAATASGTHSALHGVWTANKDDAWAVGYDDSVVLHWNGAAWSPADGVPTQGFVWRAVWGAAANDVWIVGADLSVSGNDGNGAAMLHWDGHAWTPHSGPEDLGAIWGTASNDVWATGDAHGLYHWNGQTWSAVAAAGLPQIGTAIWGSSAHDLGFGFRDAAPIHSDGTGVDANDDQNLDIYGLWGSGPKDVWAVGVSYPDNLFADSGIVFHYDGSSWKRWPSFGASQLDGVWGSGPNDVWAIGFNGDLVHWDGSVWSPPPGPPRITLYSVWASGPTDVYGFGYDRSGLAAQHFDGQSWSKIEILDAASLHAGEASIFIPYMAWGSGPSDIWLGVTDLEPIAGNPGSNTQRSLFVHWDGQHGSVDSTLDPTLASLLMFTSIWGSGQQDIWAVGNVDDAASNFTGRAVHWDGTRWSEVTTIPAKDVADGFDSVWSSGASDVWIGGGTAIHHWDGQSWTQESVAGVSGWLVSGSGPKDVWAVGAKDDGSGVSLHWDGMSWQTADVPIYPNAVVAISPTNVWAKNDDGMAHWDGQSWALSDAGTTFSTSNLWWDGKDVWTEVFQGLLRHP